MLDNATLTRAQRAVQGAAAGALKVVSSTWLGMDGERLLLWDVESTMSHRTPHRYTVGKLGADWRCTCPDFQRRHRACKHIILVQLQHQQRIDA